MARLASRSRQNTRIMLYTQCQEPHNYPIWIVDDLIAVEIFECSAKVKALVLLVGFANKISEVGSCEICQGILFILHIINGNLNGPCAQHSNFRKSKIEIPHQYSSIFPQYSLLLSSALCLLLLYSLSLYFLSASSLLPSTPFLLLLKWSYSLFYLGTAISNPKFGVNIIYIHILYLPRT